MWFPVDERWPLSDTFQGHLDRNPPSKAPGIDIACPNGTRVLSPAPGVVTSSSWGDIGGRAMWIQYKGWRLYICHLSRVIRLESEIVHKYDLLALTGNTGHSTGPHLHLSVVRNGVYIDPVKFFELGKEV